MEPWPRFLTVKQAADILQMSEDRVYRLIRKNGIPGALEIDGQYRISARMLWQWGDGQWPKKGVPGELTPGTDRISS